MSTAQAEYIPSFWIVFWATLESVYCARVWGLYRDNTEKPLRSQKKSHKTRTDEQD